MQKWQPAIVLTVFVAFLLSSPNASAMTCPEKCESAYIRCASVKATGCEIGSDLAGMAAEKLGEQIPIPGMGALFGGMAKKGTKEACRKKLEPCEQIKQTCMAECGIYSTGADGSAASDGSAPLGPAPKATFRVFSDRPRSIVYINGERMGATPADPLEPFITPHLRVGKYWVKLMTPDKEWTWEGAKDVEEGNVNAVEGVLENVEDKTWAMALTLDRQGEAVKALEKYNEFVDSYPDSKRVVTAMERISALRLELAAAEQELFTRIESEDDLETRVALCQVYIKAFNDGPRRARVNEILTSSKKTLEYEKKEAAAYAWVSTESDPELVVKKGNQYLSVFPEGPHKTEVLERIEAARAELKTKKETEFSRFRIGVVGLLGAARTSETGGASTVYNPRLAGGGGIAAEFFLFRMLGVSTGFLFQGEGFKIKALYGDNATVKLLYFQIPLLVKTDLFGFQIGAGLAFEIAVKGKTVYDETLYGEGGVQEWDDDQWSSHRTTNIGFKATIGYAIEAGRIFIVPGAEFMVHLRDDIGVSQYMNIMGSVAVLFGT